MSSRIPRDLLLASPEEAADKLATYMVFSRQAGGFTKVAETPWYENVGNAASDFWDKNIADPARSLGETAGSTFSEYWDKYVDSITGGSGPGAQTLALAGTGAGLGGIYGLVSELARKKKERRWSNPLLYAGLGGAMGGGAGLAYHNIPGLKGTVDDTVRGLTGKELPPPTEEEAATAVATPPDHRTRKQQDIADAVAADTELTRQEIGRGMTVVGTDPRALTALGWRMATGEPTPEFIREYPYLGAIMGTTAGKALSMALTSAHGLAPTGDDWSVAGVPSHKTLQKHLGSVGGFQLTDDMITGIRNELTDYAGSLKGKTKGRLPAMLGGGMPNIWLSEDGSRIQRKKPSRAERAKVPVPPWQLDSPGFTPGQQKMRPEISVAAQLKRAYNLDETVANKLAKALHATGPQDQRALDILLSEPLKQRQIKTAPGRHPPANSEIKLEIRRHPDTGNLMITDPKAEFFAAILDAPEPTRVEISGRMPGEVGAPVTAEDIQRTFGMGSTSAEVIERALLNANKEMAKPGVADNPGAVERIRNDLNKKLAKSRSSRRFPLEATLVDGRTDRWTIVETVKPVLRMRSPFGDGGLQLPFHRTAPSTRSWHKLRGGRIQKIPKVRLLPRAAPIGLGIIGGYQDLSRARQRAAERAAIKARAGTKTDGQSIFDLFRGIGQEADRPRQEGRR